MTRKEVIKVLLQHSEHWKRLLTENICSKEEGLQTVEAFDMAIKALEQEPCEDAISRKDLLSKAWFVTGDDFPMEGLEYVTKGMVENMSSVNPQPKTGHWIIIDKELQRYKCSECGEVIRLYKKSEIPKLEKDETLSNYPFSHCGARMVES